MKIVEVIPSKVYRHKVTGRRASIYGAHPEPGAVENWEIVQVGWTWKKDDGTIGLGCVPAATQEEAEKARDAFNALFDRRAA